MSKNKNIKMTEAQKIALERKKEIKFQKGEMKGKELLDYRIERKFIEWNANIRDREKFLRITPNKVYGGVFISALTISLLFTAIATQEPAGITGISADYNYVFITDEDDNFMKSIYTVTYDSTDELKDSAKNFGYNVTETDISNAYKSYDTFVNMYEGSSELSMFLHSNDFINLVGFVVEDDVNAITVLQNDNIKTYIVENYNISSNAYDSIVKNEDTLNSFLGDSANATILNSIKEDKELGEIFSDTAVEMGGEIEDVTFNFDSDLNIYDVSDFEDSAYSAIEPGGYIIESKQEEESDKSINSEIKSETETAKIEGRNFIQLPNYTEELMLTLSNVLDIYDYDTFVKNVEELSTSQLILFIDKDDLSSNLALTMFIMDLDSSSVTKDVKLKTVLYDESSTFTDLGFEMTPIDSPTLVKFNNYGDGIALDELGDEKTYSFSDSLNSKLDFANGDATTLLAVTDEYVTFFNNNANQTGMTQMSHISNNEDILDISRLINAEQEDVSGTTADLNK